MLLVSVLRVSNVMGGKPTEVIHRERHNLRDRQHRSLNDQGDPPVPTLFVGNGDGDGSLGGFPVFEDEDGDGMPDWLDDMTGMPDWSNMDWDNFSLENFDWNNVNWNPDEWNGFLQSLLGGTNGGSLPPMEFCPILEGAVGIGQSFGLAGGCSCDGTLGNGLSIDCKFEECLEGSLVCGTVGLNVTVEDSTGLVKTTVCMDTALDQYEEICFSYQFDMTRASGNVFDMENSCTASYGNNPCSCTMEAMCLAIDCSAYLPGAKMDTCQALAFELPEDAVSLMPRFAIFNDSIDGIFNFENIDWLNLDWQNIDWNNFDFGQVDWTNVDWASTPWGSLFNNDMTQVDVCPILTGRVLGMPNDVLAEGCSCEGELTSGFNVLCSFEKQCVSPPTGEVAIARDASSSPATICGDVALDLAFDNVGAVTGNLCVDFAEDVHPITCVDYSIPVAADQENLPKCQATYGGDICECTIEQNLCVKIDCSMYEPTAVMDTCQILAIENQGDTEKLVPRFGIPSPAVEDEEASTAPEETIQNEIAGENIKDETPSEKIISEANELESSGALSTSMFVLASLAALLSALAL